MQPSVDSPASSTRPARIMIIDDNEIFRAACRALLRTEGLEVVADVPADEQALRAARVLRPDAVIVDVTPAARTGPVIADRLRALPTPPIVILTSSTRRQECGIELNGHLFIAKPDICAAGITRMATLSAAGRQDRESWRSGEPPSQAK